MHFVAVKASQIPAGLGIYSSVKNSAFTAVIGGVICQYEVYERGTKGVSFLSQMVYKRVRGGAKVGGPSSYNTLLSAPLSLGHAASSCVIFGACYCHILYFLLFIVFNWNASIFLVSKSSVHSFGYFSRETSRGSVRPIKTFLHDGFFPCTLVRANLSNFVKNLQTSSRFYRSDNHGLTQSSHEVFNYVAVTKS